MENNWTKEVETWQDMPEPKALMLMTWEDIVYGAEEMGVQLTKAQVIRVMENTDMGFYNDEFWAVIKSSINQVLCESTES